MGRLRKHLKTKETGAATEEGKKRLHLLLENEVLDLEKGD